MAGIDRELDNWDPIAEPLDLTTPALSDEPMDGPAAALVMSPGFAPVKLNNNNLLQDAEVLPQPVDTLLHSIRV